MINQAIVEDIERVYSLWSQGDPQAIDVLFSRLSPDIKWKSLANGEHGLNFTRPRNGLEETRRYFEELLQQLEMVHYTVTDLLSKEDLVIAICDCAWKDRYTGRMFEGPKIDLFRLKDDAIVEFQEIYDTARLATVCALSRIGS